MSPARRRRGSAVLALAAALSLAPPAGWCVPAPPEIVWVRFADRGALAHASGELRAQAAARTVSARSLERRRRRGEGPLLLESDLPVDAGYVAALAERGFRVRVVSRWLNAASVEVPAERLAELESLPFVRSVDPAPRGLRSIVDGDLERPEPIAEAAGAPKGIDAGAVPVGAPGDASYYGYSLAQNRLVGVDRLHAAGLTGRGILVALLDTGFRETHEVFDSLDVVARRDFVFHDSVVSDDPLQDMPGQDVHGTMTLSVLGANLPGRLVGAAYGASFALAKTEYVPRETPVEMDYWQAGAEWADSLGADVISSSLGYSTFDSPFPSYGYGDMDGRTTPVTLAAAEAARRGIVVVTAQGNEGGTSWHYLIAPADAESVCAVGALDSTGLVRPFSSYGPSADGRVKPDVSAMGSLVSLAASSSDSTIFRASGTSFSTPEIAGLAALLLEAHPEWKPFDVLEALRATAGRFLSPDSRVGYGEANGEAALAWTQSSVFAPAASGAAALVVVGALPARRGDPLTLWLRAGEVSGPASVAVFDTRGRRVRDLFSGTLRAQSQRLVPWDGRDLAGLPVRAGVYFVRFEAPGVRLGRRLVLL